MPQRRGFGEHQLRDEVDARGIALREPADPRSRAARASAPTRRRPRRGNGRRPDAPRESRIPSWRSPVTVGHARRRGVSAHSAHILDLPGQPLLRGDVDDAAARGGGVARLRGHELGVLSRADRAGAVRPGALADAAGRRGRRRLRPPHDHAPRAAPDDRVRRPALLRDRSRRGLAAAALRARSSAISVSFAFDSPARQALVPSLVPLEALPARGHLSVDRAGARVRERPRDRRHADRERRGRLRLRRVRRAGGAEPARARLRAAGARSRRAARAELARGARGNRLRASQPDDLGLHDARHVRGDLRRRDRAAADLRDRHPARRRARLRAALVVARDRRALAARW